MALKNFPRSSPSSQELLYSDERRLEAYSEQLRSLPSSSVVVPSWVPELVGHRPPVQTPDRNGKISRLLQHLQEREAVSDSRPTGEEEKPIFRLETCDARRVCFPRRGEKGLLPFWIFEAATPKVQKRCLPPRGLLYLFEDFPGSDGTLVLGWGRYGFVSFVNDYMRTMVEGTDLERTFGQLAGVEEELGGELACEPLDLFRRLEAHMDHARRVQVLYRVQVRSFCSDTTFGYPIFIASVRRERKE